MVMASVLKPREEFTRSYLASCELAIISEMDRLPARPGPQLEQYSRRLVCLDIWNYGIDVHISTGTSLKMDPDLCQICHRVWLEALQRSMIHRRENIFTNR